MEGEDQIGMVFDLIERRDWEGVNALVQSVPDVASVVCRFTHGIAACVSPSGPRGNLALHEACKHHAPIRIVNLILEANMDAVKSQGQFGYLPLHVACSSGASLKVVSRLIELYPSATILLQNGEPLTRS
jgi:ankyrin repeat protein